MKEEIEEIQKLLLIPVTGNLDEVTISAIKNFQIKNGFNVTGDLTDPETRSKLGLITEYFTTDLAEKTSLLKADSKSIWINHFLPLDQYVTTPIKKEYIFLHHTAGWDNPYAVVDDWAKDSRGRIATEFIIGGKNIKTGSSTYDGICLRTFKTNGWASHLGPKPIDQYMHSHSIGIELCNFGWLTCKDHKYYNYLGQEVPTGEIIQLKEEFRGYLFWHKYSEEQIAKLKELLLYLATETGIDITVGLKKIINRVGANKAFGYWDDITAGKVKGLLTHANVRRDKFDCSPQPLLVDMIMSL